MSRNTANDISEDERLFEEAFDLIIRLKIDPTNQVAIDLAKNWRSRSETHERVWTEAVSVHAMANKVIRKQNSVDASSGLSRRSVLFGAGLVTVGAASGAVWSTSLIDRLRADRITSTAELDLVDLPDGSKVTLGPRSAFLGSASASTRQVELLDGMAHFNVAPDPSRAFQVTAGRLTVSAFETEFDLEMAGDTTFLTVNYGELRLSYGSRQAGRDFSAGSRISVSADFNRIESDLIEPENVATWREGFIVSERDRVDRTVARIARWCPGRVVIANTSLGSQRISGVYNLNDPLEALRAVVQPHGGKVRTLTPWLTVISTI